VIGTLLVALPISREFLALCRLPIEPWWSTHLMDFSQLLPSSKTEMELLKVSELLDDIIRWQPF